MKPQVKSSTFAAADPLIGMDLTRRTVRFQVTGGKEVLYAADGGNGRDGSYWVFSECDNARDNAVRIAATGVARCEKAADAAMDALEKAKALVGEAERWTPRDGNDVE